MFGSSIRGRLLTVGMLPLLAMCLVVLRSADRDISNYQSARLVAEASSSVIELSHLQAVLRNERVASLDLTAVSTSDFFRSALLTDRASSTLDDDVTERFEQVTAETDEALQIGEEQQILPAEAVERIERLAITRQRTREGAITPAELDLYYLRLIEEINVSLETQSAFALSSDDRGIREDLRAETSLTDLMAHSGDLQGQLTLVIERMLVGAVAAWDELDLAVRSMQTSLEGVESVSDSRNAPSWNDASYDMQLSLDRLEDLTFESPTATDPELDAILEDLMLARSNAVAVTMESAMLLDDVAEEINTGAGQARRRALRSVAVSLALLLFTIAMFMLAVARISRSIIAPLERASAIAKRVGRGELTEERIGSSGPVEVQAVSTALDDMIENLALIERQADALATGNPDDEALNRRLPGDLGATLESTVGRWREVTAQSQAANALNEAIALATSDAQLLCDTDLAILDANPAAASLFAQSNGELLSRGIDELLTLNDGRSLRQAVDDTPQFVEEATATRAGKSVPVILTATKVASGHSDRLALSIRDVSEREELLTRLSHQLQHDSLTGLLSRPFVLEQMESTLAADQAGLIVLGLNRFKAVNDQLGQAQGDELLRRVANRLATACRSDDFVARMGGDEFVVFIPGLGDLDEVRSYGIRLLAELKRPIVSGGRTIQLTASAGAAVSASSDPDQLLQEANLAQQEAKAAGGDRLVAYDDELMAAIAAKSRIEAELVAAIRSNRLTLWFQPVVSAGTGGIVGAEALIRWPQPDGTIRPPVEFVPLAEQSDLILQLDRWVINAACRQLSMWDDTELSTTHIAINISARHFTGADLQATVGAAMKRWGIGPGRLSIEVTESYLADDLQSMRTTLEDLHQLGVRLLIDDFGTGYSSMTYLHELPFDVLKIDRAFVARVTQEERSRSIVETLVTLGHRMGLDVLVEGIETEAQMVALRAMGCDQFQGFLIARPMPPDLLEEVHSTLAVV